ncbi:MAG: Ig-like domain-containing protein, partial [Bacteroidota bacterium]
MARKNINSLIGITLSILLSFSLGCQRTPEDLEPADFPVNGIVFLDGFSAGLEYAAFGGSDVSAFEVVDEGAFDGTSVMRFSVPDFDDPSGAYAGGAFFVPGGRDMSGFNVLTFWAKASKEANIDILGFGNDLGANRFVTTITNTPVNTNWRKYYIPIPDASKLTQEQGMFFYSEGPEDGRGYTFWIDEVQYENLGTIREEDAAIFNGVDSAVTAETGAKFSANGFAVFNLPTGVNQRVEAASSFFTYVSSDPMVATVSADGTVTVMDAGEATITATLVESDAGGSLKITST